MTRDEKRTIECIADQVAGLLQVGGTTVEYPLTAVEVAALRAALAPPSTCGTCRWVRHIPAPPFPGDTEPVCAHESEAHPLHWCKPVGNPDAFGCTFHEPTETPR